MLAYRFDPDYTVSGRHYAHPLIHWPTIIAGVVAAIAIGFVLNALGLAIGATTFNPYAIETQDEAVSIGGGLYVMFAQLLALQIGAYIAARGARYPDLFGGALTGFMVWALAVVVAAAFATFAAGQVAGGEALSAGAAETAAELSNAADGQAANSAALADAKNTVEAVAVLSWWAVGALLLGLAGAIAGGWLGAHHPKWEARPRLDDAAAYQTPPKV
jgi:hypothetical protein